MSSTLAELARQFELELSGQADLEIKGVCTLTPGLAGHIGFLANPRYRAQLAQTQASAVILSAEDAQHHQGNVLIARDPYLAFARIASSFAPAEVFEAGVHPSASIAVDAEIASSACVAANAVIEAGAILGEHSYVGPGCYIGRSVRIGDACRLEANVYLGDRVVLGQRVRVNPGAVIGSRGFGLARGPQGWEEVPQMGTVRIGSDVEIGANTSIDRGAIEDTVIGNGAKLDNQIQVAHNVHIGEHTAIAACVGIAGSTRIGARCLIGGGAGISGHLQIGDDVMIMGFSMVSKSLSGPGQFGSAYPAIAAGEWRKQYARVRRLEKLEQRLAALERQAQTNKDGEED